MQDIVADHNAAVAELQDLMHKDNLQTWFRTHWELLHHYAFETGEKFDPVDLPDFPASPFGPFARRREFVTFQQYFREGVFSYWPNDLTAKTEGSLAYYTMELASECYVGTIAALVKDTGIVIGTTRMLMHDCPTYVFNLYLPDATFPLHAVALRLAGDL